MIYLAQQRILKKGFSMAAYVKCGPPPCTIEPLFVLTWICISQFCGFELGSCQTKDYEIGICCFSDKHTPLMRKSKDWLARNQDNVSEWGNMFICGLLFGWSNTKNQTKHVGLIQSGPHRNLTCPRHDIAEKLMSWH